MNKIKSAISILCILSALAAWAQPGTVKQEKLIDFELQSSALIGDGAEVISTAGYRSDVYWFRATFNVPEEDKGRHFQLVFKGINYRAAVWVNGVQITDSTKMAGMFAQYSLDVSDHILSGGKNALAVKIYPLDYPGLPSKEQLEALGDFYPNGGPTGDIGKSLTLLNHTQVKKEGNMIVTITPL